MTAAGREDTADLVELGRLQAAYADVVTRRAWPELARLVLPSAPITVDTVTAPARTFTGPEEFGGFVSAAVSRFDHFEFVILNSVVELGGADTARGRIFMCEIRHEPDPVGWTTAYGLYQDDYRRHDGAWWFAARRYTSLARTGPSAGQFGVPGGLGPIGR